MTLHRVALAACPPQPWRNGGGRTRELLAWPQAGDWQLRVSVAEIESDGPFSAYPGVERWFAVIEGAGVVLALPGGATSLGPGDDPVFFPGEAAPGCRLTAGATRDLNLMTGRAAGIGRMMAADAGSAVDGSTRWRGVFAAAPALLDCAGVAEPVPAGTLVWSDDAGAARWAVRQATRAWWMTLEAQ
jgi:uncharacterized protein